MSSNEASWIETEDWHTAGEPFRIVDKLPTGHLPEGQSVAERRFNVMKKSEHPLNVLRQLLCHEPRGHADMYGGFVTPPNDSGAHFGVLFWHKDGFSTACGHGTIALGYWAVNKGLVKAPEGDGIVEVVVDVPSGRVVASVAVKQGKPIHADFINVLSYQLGKGLPVKIPSHGSEISVDLGFGGAVYATVDAAQLGLKVEPNHCGDFIKLGREIKVALGEKGNYGTYGLYGIIFYDEGEHAGDESVAVTQRNVTIFADGQVDRSPCGSGTCTRLAILLAEGRLRPGCSKLLHRSIIGTLFEADIVCEEKSPLDEFPACIPRVRGHANLVGRMNFLIDPADPVFPGFLLR
ncbi:Diaminopimelate epimerase-like protein [Dothidotthia symphoricarpi CBS 119687]|uniref:trans-L-3-hydroxyproline dehydratase n=1 Tax=Dothidotthia symphoricarpi CBS 119687 TaxID=1392245 RepID=A0A6A6AC34_9PLEO|nr:Diaminopimelate epimerase-like protein [Dothidotthia symphoricarpi CBS 119687]KAF2128271.1 Diaminopimelate epimerase-like protein [Dothidotthia symphoricarpi CBS 119687]